VRFETVATRVRILLADDHPVVLDRLVAMLSAEFDVVNAVGDGQSALDAAAVLKPDLFVLDISMPVLTGLETAARLARTGNTTPIVILTVHDDPVFLEAARNAGVLGYVLKSHMATDLLPAMREALAGRSFVSPSLRPSHSSARLPATGTTGTHTSKT
jgi:DNA-binding NarL/FixJ family response regulator